MDRNEFVSTLRAALTGEVSPAVVEDNVRYYQNYISQEIASGKSEKEVLEELGDPRLIARTIIDTQGNDGYGSDQPIRTMRKSRKLRRASMQSSTMTAALTSSISGLISIPGTASCWWRWLSF